MLLVELLCLHQVVTCHDEEDVVLLVVIVHVLTKLVKNFLVLEDDLLAGGVMRHLEVVDEEEHDLLVLFAHLVHGPVF